MIWDYIGFGILLVLLGWLCYILADLNYYLTWSKTQPEMDTSLEDTTPDKTVSEGEEEYPVAVGYIFKDGDKRRERYVVVENVDTATDMISVCNIKNGCKSLIRCDRLLNPKLFVNVTDIRRQLGLSSTTYTLSKDEVE